MVFGDALSSDSPDPAVAITVLGLAFSGMVYDSLVALDNDWNVSPMLATDYEISDDFMTYTFELREGVEFHNGKPFDADDVVFSFQRIFEPDLVAAGLSQFEAVMNPNSVKAVDKRTARFDLISPDAYFLIKLGFFWGKIVPAGTTDFDASKGSFGTGAFKVTSFAGGEGFNVERNENYWQDGLPYLDAVEGQVILEPATRSEAVLTGDADIADPTTFDVLESFNASEVATLTESPFGPAYTIGIDGSTPPFNDPDVRRASQAAVDRQAMVDIAARGFASVSPDSVVNPNEPFWPDGVEPEPYDPELARSLLEKSGFDGKLTIWGSSDLRALGDGAALLNEQWGEVGFNTEVKDVPFDDLFAKRILQEKIVGDYWLRQHFSTAFPFMYTSDGIFNEARIQDPTLDKLVAELEATPLEDGGEDLLREVLSRYNDEAASIWPFHMKDVWPRKKRVGGLEVTPVELVDMRKTYVIES
jgi:peptide/nickel transport system substrate-binding protein